MAGYVEVIQSITMHMWTGGCGLWSLLRHGQGKMVRNSLLCTTQHSKAYTQHFKRKKRCFDR